MDLTSYGTEYRDFMKGTTMLTGTLKSDKERLFFLATLVERQTQTMVDQLIGDFPDRRNVRRSEVIAFILAGVYLAVWDQWGKEHTKRMIAEFAASHDSKAKKMMADFGLPMDQVNSVSYTYVKFYSPIMETYAGKALYEKLEARLAENALIIKNHDCDTTGMMESMVETLKEQ